MVQVISAFLGGGVANRLHVAGKFLADRMQPQCREIAGPVNSASIGFATGSNVHKSLNRIGMRPVVARQVLVR